CRTFARSKPMSTSTLRCTARPDRFSFAAFPSSTAVQLHSYVLRGKPDTGGSRISTVPRVTNRCPRASARCHSTSTAGPRVGPGRAYLRPAMDRANLTLLTNTRARRIRVTGGTAVGVECVGPDGAIDLIADRIVLSAGAIGSAHLLMLSGVGPQGVLRAAG